MSRYWALALPSANKVFDVGGFFCESQLLRLRDLRHVAKPLLGISLCNKASSFKGGTYLRGSTNEWGNTVVLRCLVYCLQDSVIHILFRKYMSAPLYLTIRAMINTRLIAMINTRLIGSTLAE